jgi:formylglycine-generating enzyme required for sulfatase activity
MADVKQLKKELEEIKQALAALTQGSTAHKIMSERKSEIEAQLSGSGAIAQGEHAKAAGAKSVMVDGSVGGDVVTGMKIEKIEIITENAKKKALPFPEAMAKYLANIIAAHQSLRLQGIRAGSQPLSVTLEKVYVSLSAIDKYVDEKTEFEQDSGCLSIATALQRYPRIVIIGDPGCGKTTLISYLGLTYARTLANSEDWVKKRLGLEESKHLPIMLPLRDFGHHLKEKHSQPGKDGPALLLDYLREYYEAQQIPLPEEFFSTHLDNGNAILLLDGMDEVAETALRQRVARSIEAFADRYGKCRYVITSREVGYENAARIGAEFGLVKVREFTSQEVKQFVHDWMRAVETTLAGSGEMEIIRKADKLSNNLVKIIEGNPRVAELAVNPLLLTVIALVHRYRAQLPERRSELYEEAVGVLLGHWDAAKGLGIEFALPGGITLDVVDRRSLLETVAFQMHENSQREIERDRLFNLLLPKFEGMIRDNEMAAKALDYFLNIINERSGLLVERASGIYSFTHTSFQEYLAARALADRKDALEYTLSHLADAWWREVILLQAGYLSTQGKRRVSELINAIMGADPKTEPEPHHHLLLAAEILFDIGTARVDGDLLGEARKRLNEQAETPINKKSQREAVLAKITASNALARLETGQITARYWKTPFGEPEWITVPAGEFWMGDDKGNREDSKPQHKLYLPEYKISSVPITNAQYYLYIVDTKRKPPENWPGGVVLPGHANHPVVNVSWYEAWAYCKWLEEKIQSPVVLPSEAEWEKAARGSEDKRDYPWGEDWRDWHCNSNQLGLQDTVPVGLFLHGGSPYGVLDMCGNVWEWTRTIWDEKYKYPYQVDDGREGFYLGISQENAIPEERPKKSLFAALIKAGFDYVVQSTRAKVIEMINKSLPTVGTATYSPVESPFQLKTSRLLLRGGAFTDPPKRIGCSRRVSFDPVSKLGSCGFRVVRH